MTERSLARELAEAISSGEAVPGSGWVAGVSAALAAALVAKTAKRSEGWSESEGARAQAIELRDRLLALAQQDAQAYETALTSLERRRLGARALAREGGRGSARDRRGRRRHCAARRRGRRARRRLGPCGCRGRRLPGSWSGTGRAPARRGQPGVRGLKTSGSSAQAAPPRAPPKQLSAPWPPSSRTASRCSRLGAMSEITDFGLVVLVVSAVFALAVFSNKLTERIPVPAPALFLLSAALAVHFIPRLGREISIKDVERVAVVALVVILFDGGMRVGWKRFRQSIVPISMLGVLGTFATAGLMTLAGRYLFDFSWTGAGILGAALAPTDPAVMFSVLGRREVSGRTGHDPRRRIRGQRPGRDRPHARDARVRHPRRLDVLGRRPRVRRRDVGRPRDRRCRSGADARGIPEDPSRESRRSTRSGASPRRA